MSNGPIALHQLRNALILLNEVTSQLDDAVRMWELGRVYLESEEWESFISENDVNPLELKEEIQEKLEKLGAFSTKISEIVGPIKEATDLGNTTIAELSSTVLFNRSLGDSYI